MYGMCNTIYNIHYTVNYIHCRVMYDVYNTICNIHCTVNYIHCRVMYDVYNTKTSSCLGIGRKV